MDVNAQFLGGAGSVTGSRYLITAGKFRFLFDCGLFQGLKELRLRNRDVFPVDAASIQVVVISHAHIDHCGYLPALVKAGFHGPIICTRPTADLLQIMLLDSAKLQEEEAEFAARKGYSKHEKPTPLYTVEDAKQVFPLIRAIDYDLKEDIGPGVQIVFRDAGHLLGSAITEVMIQGEKTTRKIVFSGDLGRYQQDILHAPTAVEKADVLFIESTYGNKDNPYQDPMQVLAKVVNDAQLRGGVLIIPAFAVGRTQALLYYLRRLIRENRIPSVPIYVDSPMAIAATKLHNKYPSYHKMPADEETFEEELEQKKVVFVQTGQQSKALNDLKHRAIIISSSGMMTGGRILHHLFNRLRKKQDTLLISGYQAEGTRGRRLVDKEPTLRMFGEDVPVNCHVEQITSMSGHADREELFRWMAQFKSAPQMVYTIHGEGKDQTIYSQAIRDRLKWNVTQPKYLDEVKLFENI